MIRIVAVGRLRNPALLELAEDYRRRIGRFAPLEIVEVADRGPRAEASLLLKAARGHPRLACDEGGENLDSRGFSQLLTTGSPCFLLGGPDGLDEEVLQRSDRVVSLSPLTFPHELARVILLEQIYRGLTLLRGHPYHR